MNDTAPDPIEYWLYRQCLSVVVYECAYPEAVVEVWPPAGTGPYHWRVTTPDRPEAWVGQATSFVIEYPRERRFRLPWSPPRMTSYSLFDGADLLVSWVWRVPGAVDGFRRGWA